MRKLACGVGGVSLTIFFLFLHSSYPQTPAVPAPKLFQIYYEVGPPVASLADTFDSEKKTRTVAGTNGMITSSAELTENEKSAIYAAIVKNDLLTIKDNFPKPRDWYIQPETAGRLRLVIDGKTKEIRFNLGAGCEASTGKDEDDLFTYLAQLAQIRGGSPCVPDPEWPRFNNVRRIIEGILKAKDDQQHIAHRETF